jgi:hypothetical protein
MEQNQPDWGRTMKKLFLFCVLLLALASAQAAQTPSQVLSSASAWRQLSDRDLRIASSYLLLQLAGLSTTPTATMSNAASWQALSDHDLLIAQTYLLTQVLTTNLGATVFTNAIYYGTNLDNGVVLDAGIPEQWFNTNADFTLSITVPVANFTCSGMITYSNYKNGNITITGPSNARYIGSASTNSMVLASGKQGIWEWFIKKGLVTNIVNISEP